MDFTNKQLDFIVIQMKNCIKECNDLVKKYGWNNEATAGCDNIIELAQSIINEIIIC